MFSLIAGNVFVLILSYFVWGWIADYLQKIAKLERSKREVPLSEKLPEGILKD
jgi:hypothetical protein